jgi:predicted exporter
MALALVIGIGIDYGLLLTLSGDDAQFGAAARSVLLCATTTLIAFIIMAFSGVGVLEDIGTTVTIGVLAMLAASVVRSGGGEDAR